MRYVFIDNSILSIVSRHTNDWLSTNDDQSAVVLQLFMTTYFDMKPYVYYKFTIVSCG
jgi:hypothetical protein